MSIRPSLLLKLLLSSALLAWLAWKLDLSAIFLRLQQIDLYWVALACLSLFVGQVLCALRWVWLARGLGLTVRVLRKIQLYFLGMFLSLFLPSIIGGDVARGYLLARGRKDAGWQAAASVILERINGVYALTLLVTACMLFLALPGPWWWFWLSAVLFLWLAMVFYPRIAGYLAQFKSPQWLAGWQALPLSAPEFRSAWWQSLPLSVVFQLLVVQAHVFLGLAVGLELSWAAYGFMVCLVALASALPVSFNGFGIREAGYIGLAVHFGGSSEAAASMALLWVLVLVLTALPGGVVLWRLGGTRALSKQH
ncbi:MAG: lysylphosphatidylglycerol synthase transmembrane domain-containing protein [Mariprofundaceae bacterium]